jgi:hypothetical protein
MPNLPPVIPMDDDFDLAALDVNQYLPPLVDPDAAAAAAATARSSAAVPHAPSSAAAARAVAVLVPDDALYAAARPSDAVATLRVEAEQPDGTWAQLGSMPPTARPEHLWRAFPSAMPVIGLTRRFKLTPLTHAGVALARAERVVTLDGSAAPVGSARPNTVASPPRDRARARSVRRVHRPAGGDHSEDALHDGGSGRWSDAAPSGERR